MSFDWSPNRDVLKVAAGLLAAATVLAFAFSSDSAQPKTSQFNSPEEVAEAPNDSPKSKAKRAVKSVEDKKESRPDRSGSSAGGDKNSAGRRASGERPATPSGGSPAGADTARPPAKRQSDSGRPAKRPSHSGGRPAQKPERPAPSAPTTAAAVRSLPGKATINSVTAALGPAVTVARMRAKHGAGPVAALVRLEPAGMICRYYELAAGEAAPFVRLCFDANGYLRTREFVAPVGG